MDQDNSTPIPTPTAASVGQRLLGRLRIAVLFGVVWAIFNESFAPLQLLIGAGVGLLTLELTDRLILKQDYLATYRFGLLKGIRYFLNLIVQIYLAGFSALYLIITHRVNVDIVEITTSLEDPFLIALLANSITLTPGTVTLASEGNRLKVIWINCTTKDPEAAGKAIKANFEQLLLGR